jgi:Dolichyl-phosphate-mannose-protein mannosyltransferase
MYWKTLKESALKTQPGKTLERLMSVAALLLLLVSLALHLRVASITMNSSLWDRDPQRHYVSGVMFYDYLRKGLGSNPVRFAEDFEVRYPELAIGHWPPMYYAVQSLYYFVAGPTIRSAQILSVITAAVLAVLVFLRLRPKTGVCVGLISVGVFLSAPLVQAAAWQVMSDLLTALFVFLAVCAFTEFLEDPRNSGTAIGVTVWGIAAILTKGSAWALAPFALLAPVISRRMDCFRSIRYWFASLGVVVLGAPFYVLTQHIGVGYQGYYSHIASPAVGLTERLLILAPLAGFAPALLVGLSLIGFADAISARWYRNDDSLWTTFSLVAGSWISSQVVFLFFLPLTREPRVLLPSLAPAIVLAARALLWVERALKHRPLAASAAVAAMGALTVASSGLVPLQQFNGYREAAAAMPYAEDGSLILNAAGYIGEGALIAERLSHEKQHRDVILRASHVFVEQDSLGNCRPLFRGADAMRTYLLQMPVRFVVLSNQPVTCRFGDRNGDQVNDGINGAVTGDPADFKLVATVSILKRNVGQVDQLRVYENAAGRTHHPSVVETPTGLDASGRVLVYHWQ